jgi:hypothetical protein
VAHLAMQMMHVPHCLFMNGVPMADRSMDLAFVALIDGQLPIGIDQWHFYTNMKIPRSVCIAGLVQDSLIIAGNSHTSEC